MRTRFKDITGVGGSLGWRLTERMSATAATAVDFICCYQFLREVAVCRFLRRLHITVDSTRITSHLSLLSERFFGCCYRGADGANVQS